MSLKRGFYYIAVDWHKDRKYKNKNAISDSAAGRDCPGTSTGRPMWVPACSLGLRFTGKNNHMKVSMSSSSTEKRCVPFLKRVCASFIPNRMEGHFRLVLAFGDSQRDRLDIPAALWRARVSKLSPNPPRSPASLSEIIYCLVGHITWLKYRAWGLRLDNLQFVCLCVCVYPLVIMEQCPESRCSHTASLHHFTVQAAKQHLYGLV